MIRTQKIHDVFEEARPMLMGLAYRILGSAAEAEDVVQDTYLSWLTMEQTEIARPSKWLTTVCTRKAVDSLRAARHARTTYIGTWLPEPIHTQVLETPESELALSQNLTTAFLLVLERLSPKERAAFLLRDVFALDYQEVAVSLAITQPACRKLVSRARANLGKTQITQQVPLERQEELVTAFKTAIAEGSVSQLACLLSQDATLSADSGGKVTAIRQTLEGADAILAFIANVLSPAWQGFEVFSSELNSGRAIVVREKEQTLAVVSFAYHPDLKASRIFILRNPDKLTRVGGP